MDGLPLQVLAIHGKAVTATEWTDGRTGQAGRQDGKTGAASDLILLPTKVLTINLCLAACERNVSIGRQ